MSHYRRLLQRVLAAVELPSASSYTWFGVRSPELPTEVQAAMDSGAVRSYLVHNLKWQLYTDFYCAGGPRPRLQEPARQSLTANAMFLRALSQANASRGSREPGWTIERADGDVLVVSRDGLSLWMPSNEVYLARGSELSPGASVGVLMPKELLRLSPGFYMALGEAEFPADGSIAILRFYWNLHSHGAPVLINALTRRLNDAGLAFRLKVVSEPERYSRCDAGVLYTFQRDYPRIAPVVGDVHEAIAAMLKPATPALTKALAPGLGLAEDPGTGLESFGMSRCQLLAEALVEAAEQGLRAPDQWMQALEARFAIAGLTLERPYLNPGTQDGYRVISR